MRMLNCDRSRRVQIAYNLLSNALKFTEECGKINVPRGSNKDWWFELTGARLGMTQEQNGQLFQPFASAHNASVPGTGLGLYISQGFMEAHGGLISASRKGLGKGATFRVELPLA